MSWSDRVIEVEGKAVVDGGEDFEGREVDMVYSDLSTVKWKVSFSRKCIRPSFPIQFYLSINFACQSPCAVYVVKGGVTFIPGFSKDSSFEERVGRPGIVPNLPSVDWVDYFTVPSILCEGDLEFKVRLSYRLDKSFDSLAADMERLRTLSSDFGKLLFETSSSDVTFKIGNESIPAHQLVLSARVPYFQRMFAIDMKEAASKIVTIEDADVGSFKELLKYIYSGQLPEDLQSFPEAYLPLAEKYDMPDLKDSCVGALTSTLDRDNAVSTLVLADLYGCSELKRRCLHSLREWRTVMTDEALEPLLERPKLLVDLYRAS